jgi:signal transduction histidine kinase/ligand-binding sensor domain-containing protein
LPFLVFILHYAAFGQERLPEESVFVTSYGTEQGLSQSMVSQVCQDSRGLIWMVTGDGLQCFDGEGFRTFRVSYDEENSFSENMMREIVESTPGQFIISTSSSILHFNSLTGEFKKILNAPGQYPRLFNILLFKKPLCWLPKQGYCFVNSDQIQPIKLDYAGSAKPPQGFYPSHVIKTPAGTLLVERNDGILEITVEDEFPNTAGKTKWIPLAKGCQGLTLDKQGNVFLISGGVIYRYLGNGKLSKYFNTGLKKSDYLFIDSKNKFWITDKTSKSIICLQGNTLSRIKMCQREGKHTDTIESHIINIFEDGQLNLWFGTDGDGMLLYSPGRLQFLLSRIGFTRCLAYKNQELWAGTFKTGLWRLNPDLSFAARVNKSILSDNIYFLDLAIDSEGKIWAATDKGLYVLNSKGKILFTHLINTVSASFLAVSGDTFFLASDNQLFRYPVRKPSLVSVEDYGHVREIMSVNGKYWLGSPFGLYVSKVSTGIGQLKQFNKKSRLSSLPVFDVMFLDKIIWAATENGIHCYSQEGKRIPSPSCLDEIQDDVIYTLAGDSLNRIWFSSNKGIGCIPAGRDRIVFFNKSNNLQSLEFNSNACLKGPGGIIYFGGIQGVNGINPALFHPEAIGPEVRLISLNLADHEYSRGIPPEFLNIELDRKSPNISGKVFATNYLDSKAQLYSFFLEGYQLLWSQPSPNAVFTYRNLPPGNYRLWAKCYDANKNQGNAKCLISIVIKPPFWTAWWFFSALLVCVILLTILLVRKVQSVRYKKKLLDLEQQNAVERERLRISKDMHDEIGASLTRISILSELAINLENDRTVERKYISQISDIAGGVVDEMSEIIWAMNPKNDTLDCFTAYFRRYASSYLETAGIEAVFRFPLEVPATFMSSEIRRNVFLTIKEALHNAVKHSQADKVSILLDFNNDILQLVIRDNGVGFDDLPTSHHGNGLVNMQKRIEDCNGQFAIHSSKGNGVSIEVKIQMKEKLNTTKG